MRLDNIASVGVKWSQLSEPDKRRRRVAREGIRYGIRMAAVAFGISVAMSLPTQALVSGVGTITAGLVILVVVAIGVVFDVVGVATAAASPVPYHARAAKKMPGARQALWMVRHADRVNNFCTDVVGDIVNTLSGAAAGTIVARLAALHPGMSQLATQILVISGVAAITVGGKAAAKGLAIHHSEEVVSWAANLLARLHVLPVADNNQRRRTSRHRSRRGTAPHHTRVTKRGKTNARRKKTGPETETRPEPEGEE